MKSIYSLIIADLKSCTNSYCLGVCVWYRCNCWIGKLISLFICRRSSYLDKSEDINIDYFQLYSKHFCPHLNLTLILT